ncbi:MAG: murein biosynthesis integral membrane protein MurJ, partial [Alkalispirochaeta sp.]
MKSSSGTVRSTAVVMISTLVSRLLGFVRIAVIGAIFGASGSADVLNVVFNIPNNLRKLLAEGALSSAFIPALSRSHVEDASGTTAKGLVRRLIGFQLVILVPIITISMLAPQLIVDVILDFPEEERQLLAAQLFRWFILYLLLISIAAVLMGTLNAHGQFLVPAVSPLWFSVAVIGSILLLHRYLGVYSMVVGVLLGGTGQLTMQIPSIIARGYSLVPSLELRDPVFRRVLRQWIPVVSTASVFTINQQIALFFASGLADGSSSAMTNAIVFWQLPFGIFAASITTVLFPAMSRRHAAGNTEELARDIENGVRSILMLLLPAGVGLMVLGHEMIAVALQRGAFTLAATRETARVLAYYSVGLFSVGAFTFLQRVSYACDDYRTPLRAAIITVVIDVVLSLWLKETVLGVAGLALANTIAFTAGLVLYVPPLRRYAPEISFPRV